jgi:hypothetical protein
VVLCYTLTKRGYGAESRDQCCQLQLSKVDSKKYLHVGACWIGCFGACWTLSLGLSNIPHLKRMFVLKHAAVIIVINIVIIVKLTCYVSLPILTGKLFSYWDTCSKFDDKLYKNAKKKSIFKIIQNT